MKSFFSWHGSASGSAAPSAVTDRTGGSPVQLTHLNLIERLVQLCQDPQAHALLRPFGSTLAILAEELRFSPPTTSLTDALSVAVDFLEPTSAPARHLQFALAAHTKPAETRGFISNIETAFAVVGAAGTAHKIEEALLQWRHQADMFVSRCKHLWELHTYFVFLEVKGDRALFEQTSRLLCAQLECHVSLLAGCLAHTKSWVEVTLRALATRELQPLLERHHADALRNWQTGWQERLQQLPERHHRFSEEHGTRFWDNYFTHLFKISWPDFVEAFEHFYLLGPCPTDLVCQLRSRVDTTLRHQVSRSTWHSLLQSSRKIFDIVEMLLAEILEDISPRIYRMHPLHQLNSSLNSPGCPVEKPNSEAAPADQHLAISGATPSGAAASESQVLGSVESEASHAPAAPKPTPWFPFTAADDADMAIPTPNDPHRRLPGEQVSSPSDNRQPTTPWGEYVGRLCEQHHPWWDASGDDAMSTNGFLYDKKSLHVAALQAVNSSIACTRRALIFRIVSGDLAQNKPILEMPKRGSVHQLGDKDEGAEVPLLPSLVVTANGTRFNCVTKFGRSSSRRALLPDCPMSEPIASRSHFNIVYDQGSDKYYLMDAGSKWGTFVRIGTSVMLSCGDWIRVGGVEFIIRYCGGGCACHKRHAHYRLHSLQLLKEHHGRMSRAGEMPLINSGTHFSPSAQALEGKPSSREHSKQHNAGAKGDSVQMGRNCNADEDSSSDEDWSLNLPDELLLLLSSRRPRGWTTASTRLCQQGALLNSVSSSDSRESEVGLDSQEGTSGQFNEIPEVPPSASGLSHGKLAQHVQPRIASPAAASSQPALVPIAPLELDFISGPRMGEKLVLCEKVCTLGRGEGNTIQVSDSQLASVSRVHCIFENSGSRWHMRDNGSTNGTWRRLSCVLEPSDLIPVSDGMSIQAGVHEFLVEEADMEHCWIPSAATLEDLGEHQLLDQKQKSHRPPAHSHTGKTSFDESEPSLMVAKQPS
mmetsp:Transcript_95289/g.188858  ORF Transcript_95289/g.188858 Transcript_95289/m.188858 type:complete len:986 (+) Transcript_95289:82-3039(+)